jgi:poly(A) polymerase Pap1
MLSSSRIKLTININDPGSDLEDVEQNTSRLLTELREIREIETVSRIPDPIAPQMSKSFGGFLIGLLTAEVNLQNAKSVFRYLSDRLGGKTIELEVEANGKKLKVSAHSQKELEAAIEAARNFISN